MLTRQNRKECCTNDDDDAILLDQLVKLCKVENIVLPDRAGSSSLTIDTVACAIYDQFLSPYDLIGHKGGGDKSDWVFIPSSLLKIHSVGYIKKHGQVDVHYFYGWERLAFMIGTFGLLYSPSDVTTRTVNDKKKKKRKGEEEVVLVEGADSAKNKKRSRIALYDDNNDSSSSSSNNNNNTTSVAEVSSPSSSRPQLQQTQQPSNTSMNSTTATSTTKVTAEQQIVPSSTTTSSSSTPLVSNLIRQSPPPSNQKSNNAIIDVKRDGSSNSSSSSSSSISRSNQDVTVDVKRDVINDENLLNNEEGEEVLSMNDFYHDSFSVGDMLVGSALEDEDEVACFVSLPSPIIPTGDSTEVFSFISISSASEPGKELQDIVTYYDLLRPKISKNSPTSHTSCYVSSFRLIGHLNSEVFSDNDIQLGSMSSASTTSTSDQNDESLHDLLFGLGSVHDNMLFFDPQS